MRVMPTVRVAPGAVVARDVWTGQNGTIPLLRAGARMTERYRRALLDAGVRALYVEDEFSRGIEPRPPIAEETRREAVAVVRRAYADVERCLHTGGALGADTLRDLGRVASLILADVAGSDDMVLAFADLSSADAYTVEHSIDVTALGLLLARRLFRTAGWVDARGQRRFDRIEERLGKLGLGLLLHDIGKLTIPADILDKPGRLDEHEWEIMRTHPVAGLDFLSAGAISPLVKVVVRSHHERWDGRGYPDGLAGSAIHQFARVASVADVFDAVTSERPYRGAAPPHVGVDIVLSGSGTQFDAEVVDVFRRTVAPYPPGTDVLLSDGRHGLVAAVPEGRADRPVVRVAGADGHPVDIDLLAEPRLEIAPVPSGEAAVA